MTTSMALPKDIKTRKVLFSMYVNNLEVWLNYLRYIIHMRQKIDEW